MTMTSWRAECNSISMRIEGLVKAGEFFYLSIAKHGEDPHNTVKRILLPQSAAVYKEMTSYCERFSAVLPSLAMECLGRFLSQFAADFMNEPGGGGLTQSLPVVQIRLTALSALRSEFEFGIAGMQDQIRMMADRAFEHLQRCLVADQSYRDKWQAAFEQGELACEKLGAVHLLWHGIWAFKVDSVGGRTDLVMGSEISNVSLVERSAIGMVLTEWKLARGNEINGKYEDGRRQAAMYAVGVLGGVELSDVRYIVIVTEDVVSLPDHIENNITYRFVNIAISPQPPSVSARISR